MTGFIAFKRLVVALVFIMITTGCNSQNSASVSLAQVNILARVEFPEVLNTGQVVNGQWIYEELEGLPPNSNQPQFTRTTTNIWSENVSPWRYRINVMTEPGELSVDRGWDGENFWNYDIQADPNTAINYSPPQENIPDAYFDVSKLITPFHDLLEGAKNSPEKLRDLGIEEIANWGKVHVIAYDWDGITAPTVLYGGFPHTILFKITENENWLVEWVDIIHTDSGEVTHRHYQFSLWEVLDSSNNEQDLWSFVPSTNIATVEELPTPIPTATIDPEKEPTRTIAGIVVPEYGFTPLLPAYLPEGMKIQNIEALGPKGGYIINFEMDGNPVMVMHQGVEVGYRWGNTPEKIELLWATVEIGAIEPMGPPGWVVLIKPHQTDDQLLPNINLLVELPDKELVMKIVESITIVTE